jgi:hypothetical protein
MNGFINGDDATKFSRETLKEKKKQYQNSPAFHDLRLSINLAIANACEKPIYHVQLPFPGPMTLEKVDSLEDYFDKMKFSNAFIRHESVIISSKDYPIYFDSHNYFSNIKSLLKPTCWTIHIYWNH